MSGVSQRDAWLPSCSHELKVAAKFSFRLTGIPPSLLCSLPASTPQSPHVLREQRSMFGLTEKRSWNTPFFEQEVSWENESKFNCCLERKVNCWSNGLFPPPNFHTPIHVIWTKRNFCFLANPSISVRKGKEVRTPFHSAPYLYLPPVSRADILFADRRKKWEGTGSKWE